MSVYLEWSNRIKTQSTSQWLTHSQLAVYKQLASGWRSHTYVGLIGPKGSGKSFIARLLEKEAGFVYARSLEDIDSGARKVVLDDRSYSRADQSISASLELTRVVFVGRKKPRDEIPCAHLELDDTDVEEFQHALFQHRIIVSFRTSPTTRDLEQILIDEASARVGIGT